MYPSIILLKVPRTIVNWEKALLQGLLIALGAISSFLRWFMVTFYNDEVSPPPFPDPPPDHDRNSAFAMALYVDEVFIPFLGREPEDPSYWTT